MENRFHTVRGYELQTHNKNKLTPAMEDYLEMIYRNSLHEKYIRVNILAQLLNVKASSASKMVRKLKELKLVDFEKYGVITLTNNGKDVGQFLLNRHSIIEKFLMFIGCKEDLLIQAELIEHIITPETAKNLELIYNFFNDNSKILEEYINYKEEKTQEINVSN